MKPDDPIKRFVEHELPVAEMPASPMDPPEAYEPPVTESVDYASLPAPLQNLWDEHEEYLKVLTVFDNALIALKEGPWKMTQEISTGLKQFFQFIDETMASHNRKEERALFPILREKLLTQGECSPGDHPITPADVMEDEHVRVGQSVAIVFTLLGLAPRIQDPKAREELLGQAVQLGQEIVETMKLHIFRENTILFPMAKSLLSAEEWAQIGERMKRY